MNRVFAKALVLSSALLLTVACSKDKKYHSAANPNQSAVESNRVESTLDAQSKQALQNTFEPMNSNFSVDDFFLSERVRAVEFHSNHSEKKNIESPGYIVTNKSVVRFSARILIANLATPVTFKGEFDQDKIMDGDIVELAMDKYLDVKLAKISEAFGGHVRVLARCLGENCDQVALLFSVDHQLDTSNVENRSAGYIFAIQSEGMWTLQSSLLDTPSVTEATKLDIPTVQSMPSI